MSAPRSKTPVDVEKLIVREYKLGWTLREVGQTFNVDYTTVRRILKRYGVPLRRYKISGDVEAMVVALYRDKRRGVTKIAKDLGLNWETVVSALKRNGISRNGCVSGIAVVVRGNTYRSMREADRKLGRIYGTVRRWLNHGTEKVTRI